MKSSLAGLEVPDFMCASYESLNAIYKQLLAVSVALEKEVPEAYYKSSSRGVNGKLLAQLEVPDLSQASQEEINLLQKKLSSIESMFKKNFNEKYTPIRTRRSLPEKGVAYCLRIPTCVLSTPLSRIADLFEGATSEDGKCRDKAKEIRKIRLMSLQRKLERAKKRHEKWAYIRNEMQEIELGGDKKDTENKIWLLGLFASITARCLTTYLFKERMARIIQGHNQ